MALDTNVNLILPRILCLHGGGTNATIFEAQCRGLIRALKPHFRLVFADGPFVCGPHPDIVDAYGTNGPFRRWIPQETHDQYVGNKSTARLIHAQMSQAMNDDDRRGGVGRWVGLLGFSQGANICASLLWTQQALSGRSMIGSPNWGFGVIMAGRPPLRPLDPQGRIESLSRINKADAAESESGGWSNISQVLKVPTLHVHGTADPGLELHRNLLHEYCDSNSVGLIEWDGAHRVPLKSTDVDVIARLVVELASEVCVTGAHEDFEHGRRAF